MVISRQELFAFISENQCRLTILFVNTHEDTKGDVRLRAFNITTVVTYLLPSCIRLLWHPTFKLRNALFYVILSFLSRFPVSLFTFHPSLCLSFFSPFTFFISLFFLLPLFPSFLRSFCLFPSLSFLFLTFPHSLFISFASFLFLSFPSIHTFCSPFFLCLSRSTFLFDSFFRTFYFLVPSSQFLPLSQLFLYPSVLSLVSLFVSLYSFLEATLVWR